MKKNLQLLLSLAALLIVIACNKINTSDPISALNSIKSEGELNLEVVGIFGQFQRASRMNTFHVNAWSGDDLTTAAFSSKADFREHDQRNISAQNSRIKVNWSSLYTLIRTANSILNRSKNLSTHASINQLLGEVYFLRAIAFFKLTRDHGCIPLPIEISVPDPDLFLATQSEIYEQIEADFLRAEQLLPLITEVGAARPNAGSARALLARLYLDWAGFQGNDNSKYIKAATSAKQVIDNKEKHGFDLLEDFEQIFMLENRFNKEAIWTVSFCTACEMSNRKYGILGISSDYGGWHETFGEIRFFEDFPKGPRKEATYLTEFPVNAEQRITTNSNDILKTVKWNETYSQHSPAFKKITGPLSDELFSEFNTDRNDFHMRYAEVLLIYAEASARAGNSSPDAWEALNKIRRRANGLNFNLSSDVDIHDGDLAEFTFTERKWEFAGEFLRWYDLIRMEKVEEALTNRNPRISFGIRYSELGETSKFPIIEPHIKILGSIGIDNYFSPIPDDEILTYPGLKK